MFFPNYCQRLVSFTAALEDQPVIVPFERECRQEPWGELLIAMNPGEFPVMMTFCSTHYAEELLKAGPLADHELTQMTWGTAP